MFLGLRYKKEQMTHDRDINASDKLLSAYIF